MFHKKIFKKEIPFSVLFFRLLIDCLITFLILFIATGISFFLHLIGENNMCLPMIYILAVLLISRYTNGYLLGIVSSLIVVFLVNYLFTYPYYAFNFTISGYPIAFLCYLLTSAMTSALTTRIKQQETLRMEAEREKLRGNLLRAVSHDLRTPLTSIVGTTSALLDNKDKLTDTQQRELITECHDDAEWLIRMVENLLSITRMSGQKAKITKTLEAVEEIVSDATQKFQKRFPNAHITVSVPDELLMVPMDAILIEQVLMNLLENAVLHGKVLDGISIAVEKKNSDAIFTVSDHGAGISAYAMKHLFEGSLSGMDSEESDNKRNMGIGLSVCISIIKAHGGDMYAENIPTGGAQFHFTLPVKEGTYS